MKVLIAIYHHLFELWCAPPWVGKRLQTEFPQLRVVQLPDYKREIYRGKKDLDLLEQPLQDLLRGIQTNLNEALRNERRCPRTRFCKAGRFATMPA